MSAIAVRGAQKRFGRVEALRGADLEVPQGSICALIGPNGAGKTTLFGLICGYLNANAGEITVLGGKPDGERLKGRIGALPQDAMLGRETSVRAHLNFLGRLQGLTPETAMGETLRVLEWVGLQDAIDRRAGTLSHGQQKRIGVAQAFLGTPELILLDEPTAGLDPKNAHDLRQTLAAERGTRTIVISSHNLQELEAICDRAAFIEAGKTIESGAIETLTHRGAEVRVRLASGPEPIEAVRAKVGASTIAYDAESRLLRVTFQPQAGREAEDVIGELLRALLDGGARIAAVSKGRSLEERYIGGPK